MENKSIQKINNQSGFTLIEMAIGLIIISLLMAFAVVAFSAAIQRGFDKKTFEDMEQIADSIAVYSQKHMRVPCPADPTVVGNLRGTERGSGANGNIFGICNTIAAANGIIPFVTLGLKEKDAKDRFGNFLTYSVSLSSTERPATAQTRNINNWCMTEPHWFQDTNSDGIADSYINLAKAAFCCGTWEPANVSGTIGNDINILGPYGDLVGLSRKTVLEGGSAAEYRTSANLPPTIANLNNTIPPVFPAYILVSHGQNGLGAYSATGNKTTTGMTAAELENANSDNIFYTTDRLAPLTPTGTPLFRNTIDDLVFWETPAQILGRIGAVSCARP